MKIGGDDAVHPSRSTWSRAPAPTDRGLRGPTEAFVARPRPSWPDVSPAYAQGSYYGTNRGVAGAPGRLTGPASPLLSTTRAAQPSGRDRRRSRFHVVRTGRVFRKNRAPDRKNRAPERPRARAKACGRRGRCASPPDTGEARRSRSGAPASLRSHRRSVTFPRASRGPTRPTASRASSAPVASMATSGCDNLVWPHLGASRSEAAEWTPSSATRLSDQPPCGQP